MTDEPKRVPFSRAVPAQWQRWRLSGPAPSLLRDIPVPSARTSQLLFISQRGCSQPPSDGERVLSPYLSTGPH